MKIKIADQRELLLLLFPKLIYDFIKNVWIVLPKKITRACIIPAREHIEKILLPTSEAIFFLTLPSAQGRQRFAFIIYS